MQVDLVNVHVSSARLIYYSVHVFALFSLSYILPSLISTAVNAFHEVKMECYKSLKEYFQVLCSGSRVSQLSSGLWAQSCLPLLTVVSLKLSDFLGQ